MKQQLEGELNPTDNQEKEVTTDSASATVTKKKTSREPEQVCRSSRLDALTITTGLLGVRSSRGSRMFYLQGGVLFSQCPVQTHQRSRSRQTVGREARDESESEE